VWEARAAGADSFLLIAAVLEDEILGDLLALGRSLKMEPLVEVHSREELNRVLGAGAKIIGVNNRDLQDFSVHLETSLDLIRAIPEESIAVSESGLSSRENIARLRDAGFDAFLIGEHLMQQDDPAQTLTDLIGSWDADNLAG
jgi:indole-3-glycerol phosphate synthase